jgi:xylulokinase
MDTIEAFGECNLSGTIVGEASVDWGVRVGTPLVPGAADACMAFWAASIDRPGRALDPGGRTGGIGVAVRGDATAPNNYGMRSPAAGVDIVGGPVAGHGLAVEWWARICGRSIFDAIEQAKSAPAKAGGVLVLPYLQGERAPRWNAGLRAEIFGLDETIGQAEIMRAVLEGTAFGLRHIVETLDHPNARADPLSRLVVAGSPARSELWNQIKADVLNVVVDVPIFPHLAAYGAALAAGASARWWPLPGAGSAGDWPTGPVRTLEPNPNVSYDAAYRRWVELGDAAVARL